MGFRKRANAIYQKAKEPEAPKNFDKNKLSPSRQVVDVNRSAFRRKLESLFGKSEYLSQKQMDEQEMDMMRKTAGVKTLNDGWMSNQKSAAEHYQKMMGYLQMDNEGMQKIGVGKIGRWLRIAGHGIAFGLSRLFGRKEHGRFANEDYMDVQEGTEMFTEADDSDSFYGSYDPFLSSEANRNEWEAEKELSEEERQVRKEHRSGMDDRMMEQVQSMAAKIHVLDADKVYQEGSRSWLEKEEKENLAAENQEKIGMSAAVRSFRPDPYGTTSTEEVPPEEQAQVDPDKLTYSVQLMMNRPTEQNLQIQKDVSLHRNRYKHNSKLSEEQNAAAKQSFYQDVFDKQIRGGAGYAVLKKMRKEQEGKQFDEKTDPALNAYVQDQRMIAGWNNTRGDVGHTFVRIRQFLGNRLFRQYSFGFFPKTDPSNPSDVVTGMVKNPDEHTYEGDSGNNVQLEEKSVSKSNAFNAVSYIRSVIGSARSYSFSGYNCTSFGVEVARAAGMNAKEGYKKMGSLTSMSQRIDSPNALAERYGIFTRRGEELGEQYRGKKDNGSKEEKEGQIWDTLQNMKNRRRGNYLWTQVRGFAGYITAILGFRFTEEELERIYGSLCDRIQEKLQQKEANQKVEDHQREELIKFKADLPRLKEEQRKRMEERERAYLKKRGIIYLLRKMESMPEEQVMELLKSEKTLQDFCDHLQGKTPENTEEKEDENVQEASGDESMDMDGEYLDEIPVKEEEKEKPKQENNYDDYDEYDDYDDMDGMPVKEEQTEKPKPLENPIDAPELKANPKIDMNKMIEEYFLEKEIGLDLDRENTQLEYSYHNKKLKETFNQDIKIAKPEEKPKEEPEPKKELSPEEKLKEVYENSKALKDEDGDEEEEQELPDDIEIPAFKKNALREITPTILKQVIENGKFGGLIDWEEDLLPVLSEGIMKVVSAKNRKSAFDVSMIINRIKRIDKNTESLEEIRKYMNANKAGSPPKKMAAITEKTALDKRAKNLQNINAIMVTSLNMKTDAKNVAFFQRIMYMATGQNFNPTEEGNTNFGKSTTTLFLQMCLGQYMETYKKAFDGAVFQDPEDLLLLYRRLDGGFIINELFGKYKNGVMKKYYES